MSELRKFHLVFILIYAVLDLISTFVISKTFKKIQNSIEENIKDAEVIEEKTIEKKDAKKKKEDK